MQIACNKLVAEIGSRLPAQESRDELRATFNNWILRAIAMQAKLSAGRNRVTTFALCHKQNRISPVAGTLRERGGDKGKVN